MVAPVRPAPTNQATESTLRGVPGLRLRRLAFLEGLPPPQLGRSSRNEPPLHPAAVWAASLSDRWQAASLLRFDALRGLFAGEVCGEQELLPWPGDCAILGRGRSSTAPLSW